MAIDGILNVDKPGGITSFGVVRLVRRLTGQRKIGHGGALDPMATGVLLILLGQATRLAEYLLESIKVYRAVVELGTVTDTYDAEGAIISKKDFSGVTRGDIERALEYFEGDIWQRPPVYSALRREGKHYYELARRGDMVSPPPRQRTVYRLNLVDWAAPLLTLELECQGGFYVRSLAYDLGELLGCGAHLKELCRLKSGGFSVERAVSLERLKALDKSELISLVSPIDSALPDKRAITLSEVNALDFVRGKAADLAGSPGKPESPGLLPAETPERELCRIYSEGGRFLGVGVWDGKMRFLYPKKVFSKPGSP